MGATVICHAEERPSPRQPRTGQLSAEEDGRTRMEPGPTQLNTISVQRAKSAHRPRLGRGRREPALAGSVSWVSHLRSEPLPAGTARARRAGPRKARAGRGERRTRRRAAAPLDPRTANSARGSLDRFTRQVTGQSQSDSSQSAHERAWSSEIFTVTKTWPRSCQSWRSQGYQQPQHVQTGQNA